MKRLKGSYVSSPEAARILGIHPKAIHKLIQKGQIPAEKIAGCWLISRRFIIEFAKSYRPKTGRPKGKVSRKANQHPFFLTSPLPESDNKNMNILLLRPKECQEIMGIGRSKLQELLNTPRFPVVRLGERTIRIPLAGLKRWLEAQGNGTRKGGG